MQKVDVGIKHPYVVSDPKICGGEPLIKGTRIPVRTIVFYILKEGLLAEELLKEFPQLTHSLIYDALSYYYDHKDEIEKAFAENLEEIWKQCR